VRQALTFFLGRNGRKPNAYIGAIAYTLRTVAKYGAVLPDEDCRRSSGCTGRSRSSATA
jgi:hypothetical protein